ncbi:hypothetical protein J1N35_018289 [Gossypium stocksii]|uniref:Uncharacterized protein n=1 Tax=Gossypium stocksii TaxID=47602 RepID=A0A9D3VPJ3_9ROSI|nr:hypothetical protein J1N35_018289 [Gossypium stocksii]
MDDGFRPAETLSLQDQNIHGGKEDSYNTVDKKPILATTADAFGPWMVVQRKSRFAALTSFKQAFKKFVDQNFRVEGADNFGPNLDEVQSISSVKLNLGDLENLKHTVQSSPSSDLQNKHSSLHFNPTFEGSLESVVDLNANLLDLKRYSTGTFKIAGNSRIPLPDAINIMAKLIGEQVETFSDKVTANDEGVKISTAL